jgi:hypothetical protein
VRYVHLLGSLVVVAALAGQSVAAADKKLIEFGWDEPDTAFLRKHIASMEGNSPFDGCVFHANWKRDGGGGGSFTWEAWSARAFTEADLAQSLADLKATTFGRMRHNFLRFNVTPGDVDWFDDAAFASVLTNARLAARLARDGGGCDGVLFDIEQYGTKLFRYPDQKHAGSKSWDDYAKQVRRRGAEVMTAFQDGYPDLVVLLTFAYSLPHAQTAGDPAKLATADYGLLAPLLDGMIDAAAGGAKIVDGYERSYSYREPQQFDRAYETMRSGVLPLVNADPRRYQRVMSFGFGVWLDYDWRKKGWDEKDPSKNYFTPEGFARSVGKALERADEYVWIYSETPKWWAGDDAKPAKLPEAYGAELRRLRRSD